MIKYFCDRCKSECDDHYLKLDLLNKPKKSGF